jgi:hypothetical protein
MTARLAHGERLRRGLGDLPMCWQTECSMGQNEYGRRCRSTRAGASLLRVPARTGRPTVARAETGARNGQACEHRAAMDSTQAPALSTAHLFWVSSPDGKVEDDLPA